MKRIFTTCIFVWAVCGSRLICTAQTVITHDISTGILIIAGNSTDNYVITGTTTTNYVEVWTGYQGVITLR